MEVAGGLPCYRGFPKPRFSRDSFQGPSTQSGRAEQGAVATAPQRSKGSRARQGAARRPGQGTGAVELRLHLFYPLEDQTPTAPKPAGLGAHPGICVLPRAPPRLPEPGLQSLSPKPSPKDPDPRCACPSADCPCFGAGGGSTRQESIFVFLSFPPRALSRKHFPIPIFWARVELGAVGEAEAGARTGQPQAGAGCAPRPRRVHPAEAALRAVRRVPGAPAAIQLPGLISSLRVRLGAGSQRAAAAPSARPRGQSGWRWRRQWLRRGGGGGALAQPGARAR